MLSANLIAVSTDLLDQFGDSITLLKNTYGDINLTSGEQEVTTVEYVTKGVFEKELNAIEGDIDGKYTMKAVPNVDLFDTIRKADGSVVRIHRVNPISIQDTVVVHELYVSRDNQLRE